MIQKSKRRERFMVYLVDSVLLFPLLIILSVLSTFHVALFPIINLIFQAICFWYYVNFQFKYSATLGKRKFGIKIYDTELSMKQCVKRYLNYSFIYILSAIILCFLIPNTPAEGFQSLSWQERMIFFYRYNKDYVGPLEYVRYIWLFFNFLFFIFDKQGRTRADYFAGTIVGKKIDDEIDTIGKVEQY